MVTLRDVARVAGVSLATASRAMSDAPHVSAANREQVARAAESLGYRPHPAARALTTGSTGTVGLVVPDLANPFFAAVAKGVQARARETGRDVLVADTDEDVAVEPDVITRLGDRVDGLVLCSPRLPADALGPLLAAAGGPVALVNRETPDAPSVSFDIADGVRQALDHLRALGHDVVAYAGGPRTSWSDGERRTALGALAGDTVLDLGSFRPTHGGGVQAADLALAAGATAVLCFNDLVALGVLARLHARGVATPADVSVVGFDDVAAASLVTPALTTVAVPLARAGRTAVDLLGAASAPPDHRRLPVELVVRSSTAPAPPTPVQPDPRTTVPRTADPEVVIR
ncbi:LacI family DNA-binding transcriptional regulator [Krasilnikoviella flava]|uniref:Transcriptional regulator, LacI family n=1 Tax=Krasilnikoviella flava TaxID=526729 RepID=A0A1T5KUP7_9MICO|nr:LacI family DNA-binding transcriptional regulator [Krasilnikoviella flava]SKC67506.1 transcriptional regulator, LacI family [Krasilnikoviella flava]